jgi:hypothetical protein
LIVAVELPGVTWPLMLLKAGRAEYRNGRDSHFEQKIGVPSKKNK